MSTTAQALASIEAALDGPLAPRPAQGSIAARSALVRAQHLAGMVRDEGPDGIGAYLDDLDLDQLYGLVTALAAMVPVGQPVADLLAWLDDAPTAQEPAA